VKYRQVLRILLDNGFEQARQRGSHRTYKGVVGGQTRIVTLSHHSLNDDVLPKTLASIIRQSGLPKSLFR
jgi:predicted RNA binding protein YcfA (HicA-like mRNA interferase family)